MKTYNLYTVRKKGFSEKHIISNLPIEELETRYDEIADHGTVTDVKTSMQTANVHFRHKGSDKKLPHENKIED